MRLSYFSLRCKNHKLTTLMKVNGRVIVDACAFYRCQDIAVSHLGRFSDSSQASNDGDDGKRNSVDGPEDLSIQPEGTGAADETETVPMNEGLLFSPQPTDATTLKPKKAVDINTFQREEDFTPMTDEQCLLANPFVKGMDVKSKEWSEYQYRWQRLSQCLY